MVNVVWHFSFESERLARKIQLSKLQIKNAK